MITVVIPCYNERSAIAATVSELRKMFAGVAMPHEIIVVDDGSADDTAAIARETGVVVLTHPMNLGYGASLKTGIRRAAGEWIGIVDADGSYPIEEFPKLLEHIPAFDMVVGARTGEHYIGSVFKHPARKMFGWLAEFVTGRRIADINSGMRVFRKSIALTHLHRFSSGFSFTTTLTMAMMMEEHFTKYVPISYRSRIGRSHVRYVRDTLRAGQIIVQSILYYNPLKLFILLGAAAIAASCAAAVLALVPALRLPVAFVWAGAMVALVVFGMGLLAFAIRASRSSPSSDSDITRISHADTVDIRD